MLAGVKPRTDARLTLYRRNARQLRLSGDDDNVRAVEGDVLDTKALEAAMVGQDVVYAILGGPLEQQARGIVTAIKKSGLKRLIFISSMGIYDDIPGERHGPILEPYCQSTGLDYTIPRPA